MVTLSLGATAQSWVSDNLPGRLEEVYVELYRRGFVGEEEVDLQLFCYFIVAAKLKFIRSTMCSDG